MNTSTEQAVDTVVMCIAEMVHEMNRIYCKAHGDLTAVPWHEAPEWQKKSSEEGVMCILRDPTITPKDLHDTWSAFKIADGWKYGPIKDATLKTHPCLVEYDQLPEYQQRKDNLVGVVARLGIALFFKEVSEDK